MDIDIDIFRFPVSLLLGAAFLLLLYMVHRYAGENRLVRALSGKTAAILSLSAVTLIVLIEGIFACNVVHSVLFIIVVLIFLFCLGLAIADGLSKKKKICYLLSHGGMFVIVFSSSFGSPDAERMKVALHHDSEPVNFAFGLDGSLNPLPMKLSLEKFTTEYYAGTRMPKQYSSSLLIDGKPFSISVNSPCSYKGYSLFQEGFYDDYSVIGISKDPWLSAVYFGMVLLSAGCVMLIGGKWKMGVLAMVTIAVTALFSVLSVARISFGTLMPALRSLWFVPHLIIYMVAYSLMAIALILALVNRRKFTLTVDRMVAASSALIAIGMLCGAVWARQAWGDYWTWDPKECLAAVTWTISLIYLHICREKRKILTAVLALAFIALQFTWYGVNYLPSADKSLHTYNTR